MPNPMMTKAEAIAEIKRIRAEADARRKAITHAAEAKIRPLKAYIRVLEAMGHNSEQEGGSDGN